jgi:3-oxoacyl-[acyl-carrier protein] reductase
VSRALVLGGTGALGSAIVVELMAAGWDVEVAEPSSGPAVTVDISAEGWAEAAAARGRFDGVVWAQGANAAGGILEADSADLRRLFDVNVVFIVETLRSLSVASALAKPARGVVLSSVWQVTARANKLAYVASKAALAGVIPAIAVDMAGEGFAINAVMPGVIDTPMTRAALTPVQIEKVESETIGGALATPGDVARAVAWLVDARAAGINGQSIAVDHGWSKVRSV